MDSVKPDDSFNIFLMNTYSIFLKPYQNEKIAIQQWPVSDQKMKIILTIKREYFRTELMFVILANIVETTMEIVKVSHKF